MSGLTSSASAFTDTFIRVGGWVGVSFRLFFGRLISSRCTIRAIDNKPLCLLLCTVKKGFIALTATDSNEFGKKMLTHSHLIEIFPVEDFQVIIDIIAGVLYISHLIQSLIDKIRFPVAQGHSGKHPRTFTGFCFWCRYHFLYLME